MKVLQVNNVYGEKSTGKLTMQIHEGLIRAGHEAVAVYGRGKTISAPGVIRLCPEWYGKLSSLAAQVSGMPYGGCFLSTWRLIRLIRREKPDVVHLQCVNGNFVNIYRLIAWLKRSRIKTVVTLHAEFMYTANCGHAFECTQWKTGCEKCPNPKKASRSWFFDRTRASWKRMKAAFSGFEEDCAIVSVSPWTESRAKQADILKGFRFHTVLNGVDTKNTFHYKENEIAENTVLNVTAHFSGEQDHPKGGWYLLQLARRMPEVTFLVAGNAGPVADCPPNLRLLGTVSDQQALADRYRQAALSVVVGKRETFSMPCAESLCCGTPVVGFEAGAPEQISLPGYSEFVPHGDVDALESALRKWLERTDLDREAIAREAREAYSNQTMVQAYLDIYGRLSWK